MSKINPEFRQLGHNFRVKEDYMSKSGTGQMCLRRQGWHMLNLGGDKSVWGEPHGRWFASVKKAQDAVNKWAKEAQSVVLLNRKREYVEWLVRNFEKNSAAKKALEQILVKEAQKLSETKERKKLTKEIMIALKKSGFTAEERDRVMVV